MADPQVAYQGLSQLAHAIRRSMAAYVAMSLTPADGTMEDWEETFDRVAAKIRGHAAEEGPTPPGEKPSWQP